MSPVKYVFEFDSQTKQMVATCDGAPIGDLRYVCMERAWTNREGKPDPDFTLRVSQMRHDQQSGVLTEMHTYASAEGALVERPKAAVAGAAMLAAFKRMSGA